jgi:hypothetical protein
MKHVSSALLAATVFKVPMNHGLAGQAPSKNNKVKPSVVTALQELNAGLQV